MEQTTAAPLATMEGDEDDVSTTSDEIGTRCGYRKWRPECLQSLNQPTVLVASIAFYSLSLGLVVNGIINVNTSSVEKRFDLLSTQVGFISSSYDITAAFLAVVVGYLGSGKRKARMVAAGIICSALGSLVLSSSHFFSDKYALGLESPEFMCHSGLSTNETCAAQSDKSSLSDYFYIFLAGQLLHGVGGTVMFTVGISLIDDSVMPNRTPLLLGIVYGCNILGAGLGYTIGGQFLKLYVDFDTTSDVDLTPEDHRWVGAWWLGPLISAGLQLLCAIPISLFGTELPSSRKVRQLRQNQAHMTSSMQLASKVSAPRFLAATGRLLKNPCFVFVTLSMVMEGMCMTGLAVFLPKFVENQFGVTAADAALFTGGAVIPAAAGGLVLGGWIAKRYNLNIIQSIKMIMALAVLSSICSAFIWIRCDHSPIYGVDSDYSGMGRPPSGAAQKSLVSQCNANCNCDTDLFEPLCANGTDIYFSPCYAGCTSKHGKEYHGCACLAALHPNSSNPPLKFGSNLTLTAESCTKPCNLLYLFIALLFFTLCLCFMPIAPADAIQLRCVHEDYKTHAQGVKTFIVRTLGSFVGPIVVGKLLDLNCNVWRKKCGSTLSCWLYDEHMLVTSLYIFILICKALSFLFCCLALKFYQAPSSERAQSEVVQHLEEEEQPEEQTFPDDVKYEYSPPADADATGGSSLFGMVKFKLNETFGRGGGQSTPEETKIT